MTFDPKIITEVCKQAFDGLVTEGARSEKMLSKAFMKLQDIGEDAKAGFSEIGEHLELIEKELELGSKIRIRVKRTPKDFFKSEYVHQVISKANKLLMESLAEKNYQAFEKGVAAYLSILADNKRDMGVQTEQKHTKMKEIIEENNRLQKLIKRLEEYNKATRKKGMLKLKEKIKKLELKNHGQDDKIKTFVQENIFIKQQLNVALGKNKSGKITVDALENKIINLEDEKDELIYSIENRQKQIKILGRLGAVIHQNMVKLTELETPRPEDSEGQSEGDPKTKKKDQSTALLTVQGFEDLVEMTKVLKEQINLIKKEESLSTSKLNSSVRDVISSGVHTRVIGVEAAFEHYLRQIITLKRDNNCLSDIQSLINRIELEEGIEMISPRIKERNRTKKQKRGSNMFMNEPPTDEIDEMMDSLEKAHSAQNINLDLYSFDYKDQSSILNSRIIEHEESIKEHKIEFNSIKNSGISFDKYKGPSVEVRREQKTSIFKRAIVQDDDKKLKADFIESNITAFIFKAIREKALKKKNKKKVRRAIKGKNQNRNISEKYISVIKPDQVVENLQISMAEKNLNKNFADSLIFMEEDHLNSSISSTKQVVKDQKLDTLGAYLLERPVSRCRSTVDYKEAYQNVKNLIKEKEANKMYDSFPLKISSASEIQRRVQSIKDKQRGNLRLKLNKSGFRSYHSKHLSSLKEIKASKISVLGSSVYQRNQKMKNRPKIGLEKGVQTQQVQKDGRHKSTQTSEKMNPALSFSKNSNFHSVNMATTGLSFNKKTSKKQLNQLLKKQNSREFSPKNSTGSQIIYNNTRHYRTVISPNNSISRMRQTMHTPTTRTNNGFSNVDMRVAAKGGGYIVRNFGGIFFSFF